MERMAVGFVAAKGEKVKRAKGISSSANNAYGRRISLLRLLDLIVSPIFILSRKKVLRKSYYPLRSSSFLYSPLLSREFLRMNLATEIAAFDGWTSLRTSRQSLSFHFVRLDRSNRERDSFRQTGHVKYDVKTANFRLIRPPLLDTRCLPSVDWLSRNKGHCWWVVDNSDDVTHE